MYASVFFLCQRVLIYLILQTRGYAMGLLAPNTFQQQVQVYDVSDKFGRINQIHTDEQRETEKKDPFSHELRKAAKQQAVTTMEPS